MATRVKRNKGKPGRPRKQTRPTNQRGEESVREQSATSEQSTGEQPGEQPASEQQPASERPSVINGYSTADPSSVSGAEPKRKYGFAAASPEERKRIAARAAATRAAKRAERAAPASTASNKPAASKKAAVHLEGLEKMLYSLHGMGAMLLQVPELEIDRQEAHVLADAVSDVMQHYSFEFDAKTAAWVNLGMAAMGIYGTRALTYIQRNKPKRPQLVASNPVPAPAPAPAPAARPNGAAPSTTGGPILPGTLFPSFESLKDE